MVSLKGVKFASFAIFLQVFFIILFGLLADYDHSAQPMHSNYGNIHQSTHAKHISDGKFGKSAKADRISSNIMFHSMSKISHECPVTSVFQDLHIMALAGFGFLMTCSRKNGYSALSFNLLIAAFVIQWGIIVRGIFYGDVFEGRRFTVDINELLYGDFAVVTVLISFGAVLGKTNPLQLLVMSLIEVVLFLINGWICLQFLRAEDVGGSVYIHTFGAYFGIAVSRVLYSKEIKSSAYERSEYHSEMFSMIGTILLWVFWPSFNGSAVTADLRHRAVINTYLSLAACTIITFAVSSVVTGDGRIKLKHIQHATLAGGVAVGTTAHMPIGPWGALLIGSVAGVISTLGFQYLTPKLSGKLGICDTCGVNNLHGMPGLLAGLIGACATSLATYDKWGDSLFQIFPGIAPEVNSNAYAQFHHNSSIWKAGLGRTSIEQAGYQITALMVTFVLAIVGGAGTGLFLHIPLWKSRKRNTLFDDEVFLEVSGIQYQNNVAEDIQEDPESSISQDGDNEETALSDI